ncbi:dephospho-CoA kinase [Ornithobacterium rhinotracheale]|uniref:dephospho-CoA kinase n=1 Tax=Ornithobacterium rhinotracheale TaxID=28251 RepID=UPI00129D056B|nr:dephospho-CoA kinase [Ornithobacterium rhinotracheale]MRJ08434.1 dephospho-CoA kinase [Ornithobacterium rhinotracheale]UOH77628.1 dephospho-CoA kinase [Ornithobacterium rhinotracheale]
MKIIGITGGIGSGKSTVAKFIAEAGFPVYNSDQRAKDLYEESPEIKQQLIEWYGENIYTQNSLNRKKLAEIIFSNETELKRINALMHPAVANDFKQWKNAQKSDFVFKETAILFESGAYKDCDFVLTISAPIENRIERATQRDQAAAESIIKRIEKQMTDQERESLADYTIDNKGNLVEFKNKTLDFLHKLPNIV